MLYAFDWETLICTTCTWLGFSVIVSSDDLINTEVISLPKKTQQEKQLLWKLTIYLHELMSYFNVVMKLLHKKKSIRN